MSYCSVCFNKPDAWLGDLDVVGLAKEMQKLAAYWVSTQEAIERQNGRPTPPSPYNHAMSHYLLLELYEYHMYEDGEALRAFWQKLFSWRGEVEE